MRKELSWIRRAGQPAEERMTMKVPFEQLEDTMPASLALSFLISAVVGAVIWSLVLFAIL